MLLRIQTIEFHIHVCCLEEWKVVVRKTWKRLFPLLGAIPQVLANRIQMCAVCM